MASFDSSFNSEQLLWSDHVNIPNSKLFLISCKDHSSLRGCVMFAIPGRISIFQILSSNFNFLSFYNLFTVFPCLLAVFIVVASVIFVLFKENTANWLISFSRSLFIFRLLTILRGDHLGAKYALTAPPAPAPPPNTPKYALCNQQFLLNLKWSRTLGSKC